MLPDHTKNLSVSIGLRNVVPFAHNAPSPFHCQHFITFMAIAKLLEATA